MAAVDTSLLSTTIILLVIIIRIFQVYSEITTGVAKRRTNLDDKISDFRMLWEFNRKGTPLCIGECSRDERCASVFYNKMTGHCQGHSVTFGDPLAITDSPNYRYYLRPHGENYIGDSCLDSNECVTVNSECRTGICQCIPGYSFSPKTHECKECTNYGNDYWEIMDHYISKKNLETLDGVTLQECFNLCNSRTEYTCVSLEYGRVTQVCNLANITVLHYPERWYHDSVQNFEIAYYQRDCE